MRMEKSPIEQLNPQMEGKLEQIDGDIEKAREAIDQVVNDLEEVKRSPRSIMEKVRSLLSGKKSFIASVAMLLSSMKGFSRETPHAFSAEGGKDAVVSVEREVGEKGDPATVELKSASESIIGVTEKDGGEVTVKVKRVLSFERSQSLSEEEMEKIKAGERGEDLQILAKSGAGLERVSEEKLEEVQEVSLFNRNELGGFANIKNSDGQYALQVDVKPGVIEFNWNNSNHLHENLIYDKLLKRRNYDRSGLEAVSGGMKAVNIIVHANGKTYTSQVFI